MKRLTKKELRDLGFTFNNVNGNCHNYTILWKDTYVTDSKFCFWKTKEQALNAIQETEKRIQEKIIKEKESHKRNYLVWNNLECLRTACENKGNKIIDYPNLQDSVYKLLLPKDTRVFYTKWKSGKNEIQVFSEKFNFQIIHNTNNDTFESWGGNSKISIQNLLFLKGAVNEL